MWPLGLLVLAEVAENATRAGAGLAAEEGGGPEQPALLALARCARWRPPGHAYYQAANAFFLLAFLAPHGRRGRLWLRGALLPACGAAALWAWAVECSADGVLWNATFFVVNFLHFVVLLYKLRPVRFTKELEEVYVALFKPLRVSRHQFRRVLHCMRAVRQLKCHELYAHEKVTKVDSLSLVLSGKLVVSQNQRALHIVFPHHFLDSPEWFGVSTDEYFQVSIMAMEESRVLVWHRDKLKLSIMSDGFLQAVFDHILGRDVVHKLMQVSETMAVSNGHLPNSYEEGEDKPMLVVKKTGDGPGITALLNRQLQGEIPYPVSLFPNHVRRFDPEGLQRSNQPLATLTRGDWVASRRQTTRRRSEATRHAATRGQAWRRAAPRTLARPACSLVTPKWTQTMGVSYNST